MSESGSVPRRSANLALIIMGVGLILIGLAAFYLLSRANQDSVSDESQQIYPVPAAVNYAAPELSLTDIKGVDSSLADYRGKVVLVNLWATWCPPCKKEMPTLQAFYNAHETDGFTIIAINDGDPAADVVQFVKDYQLTFSVWLDPKYVATEQAFQSMNLPSSYVIDRSGIIRLRWLGEISDEMLEKYVTPIIME